ncbi:MAG: putative nucleoside-diphosphate sugar epimerase [Osedax symbiont Rs1]|nr:MAG: putative nucleoside-diphosphate sugar epimerase [Osedax symbiont Rs1]
MTSILSLIGRKIMMFTKDIERSQSELLYEVGRSSFLVLGGAGTIGQAVTKEIFKRSPKKLHVVDISENNLVELVRDIRSSFGYINGDFQTFALDIASVEYDAFHNADGQYDYVLNLSALKHVRSEKDPYTLMRMISVNIFNTDKTIQQAINKGTKKYFCVSTDKAANPANLMGASKSIMEMFLWRRSEKINISTARFANVAFSDGSLLHGFNQRIQKKQPIVAPSDIKRYFVTSEESGILCLMSCILGKNRDIFYPKLCPTLNLTSFPSIAEKYLHSFGFTVFNCSDEDEARKLVKSLPEKGMWPCFFSKSDTTGEKSIEEFFTDSEVLDITTFENIGVIKNTTSFEYAPLDDFEGTIRILKSNGTWTKEEIVTSFKKILPDFDHLENDRYLDGKM